MLSSTDGLVADLLARSGCGFSYEAKSASSLADTIIRAADNPASLEHAREAAREVFLKMFDADDVYGEYSRFVIGLARTTL